MRYFKRKLLLCLCLILSVGAGCLMAFAAEPRVILTDYELGSESVSSGDAFSLTITIRNTANKKVKNLKISLVSEDGSILPAKGAGTAYVAEIAAETDEALTFDMKTINGLEEKAYKLTVRTAYEDVNGMPYMVEDSLYVPVVLENRISITELTTAGEVKIGDEAEITATVNNMGEGTVHNVRAKISGKSVETQDVYLGNIQPGNSANVDILAKANAVVETDAEAKNTLTVTYEDANGTEYTEEKNVTIYVRSSSYEDLEVLKQPAEKKGVNKMVVALVCVGVLAVAVLVLAIVKSRKKRKLLEDF